MLNVVIQRVLLNGIRKSQDQLSCIQEQVEASAKHRQQTSCEHKNFYWNQ